jgi:UDP-galactopyranose mutase
MKKYDFLIVGAGLFGSVFAQQAIENGYTCLIIDKRKHNGGNVYTENVEGINIHKYGAHIFRTSDDKLWEYVNRFTKFNNYTNRVKVSYKNEIYSFPINLLTLNKVFGCKTPEEAILKLEEVKVSINSITKNLEEHLLSTIGEDLYKIFFYGYTKKQWGREPKLLPKSIISRIPIRTNFDDNYFNDKYQGIPIGGYTKMIEKMQKGADLVLEEDYFENKNKWDSISNMIVYTGPIDQFYDYKFGKLEYRSLKFEEIKINKSDYQGCAVMNFTDDKIEYTRIIEHKHFEFGNQKFTIISKEYPQKWSIGKEPYYPINDDKNNNIYLKYKKVSKEDKKIIFGGRLAEYRYYDMQQVIASALSKFKKLNLENKNNS